MEFFAIDTLTMTPNETKIVIAIDGDWATGTGKNLDEAVADALSHKHYLSYNISGPFLNITTKRPFGGIRHESML